MGGEGSKSAIANNKLTGELSRDEAQCLEAAFKSLIVGNDNAINGNTTLDRIELQRRFEEVLDEFTSVRLCQSISIASSSIPTTHRKSKQQQLQKQQGPHPMTWSGLAMIASQFLHGSCTDQCQILFRLASTTDLVPVSITATEMVKFVSVFVEAYLKATSSRKNQQSWLDGTRQMPTNTQTITMFMLRELFKDNNSRCDNDVDIPTGSLFNRTEFENWYCRSSLAAHIIYNVIRTAFRIDVCHRDESNDEELLPACHDVNWTKVKSVLTLTDVLFLNQQLPASLRHRWRYLFSSRQHGESFSQLIGRIIDRGPSFVIIKTKNGEMFGGFATESWKIQSKFYGSSESFLFTLNPQMGIYPTTGYNDHYMYLNLNQQTMPNGLGMGGQLDYFGLYIDSDYGRGRCTKSCTTFQSPQLSSDLEYDIETIEVWGVGPEPKQEEGVRGSALDTLDPELKAILEMTGKSQISGAIREADQKAETSDNDVETL